MSEHDGNGWTRCDQGHRHWGRFGAAGLLVGAGHSADAVGVGNDDLVLLHERNHWVSHGGTWGPPGGARDSHESAVDAALREAWEECGIAAESVTVTGLFSDDHGGWSYQTVLATAPVPFAVAADRDEAAQVAWIPVSQVPRLRLHPGFSQRWPLLRGALRPLTVIVDGANVVGSRPDGWWRDRAGAAARLRDQVRSLAARGVARAPGLASMPPLTWWYPRIILVVEGAAARAAAGWDDPGGDLTGRFAVVRAPGSGDDRIAELAASTGGYRLVVTADRELRGRCLAAGAAVTGPRWLLDQLAEAS